VKFVTLYLEFECLWNPKCPLYKNKQAKAAATQELERAMGIQGFSDKEVKQKIKNIRTLRGCLADRSILVPISSSFDFSFPLLPLPEVTLLPRSQRIIIAGI